jgi:hypothetical protein
MESLSARNWEQMPSVRDYFVNTFTPILEEIHDGPKMFLEAIVAPHTPQMLFLSAFPSFEEMLVTRSKIAAHPDIQRARAGMQSSGTPVLAQVQSQVLVAGQDDLQFPADLKSLSGRIIELRSYLAPAWQKGPLENISAIFARAGMKPILNAAAAAGEHLPQFSCLIPFDHFGVREEAWARFEADPEWIRMQEESRTLYGFEAKATGLSIFKLAPYSKA